MNIIPLYNIAYLTLGRNRPKVTDFDVPILPVTPGRYDVYRPP